MWVFVAWAFIGFSWVLFLEHHRHKVNDPMKVSDMEFVLFSCIAILIWPYAMYIWFFGEMRR